ncbi:Hypothetical protein PBC10988_28190 [Planctomycetales bacterium 10988]|nr:Hypothetical protein PBC10988_28190 [Planctomycetales bacterium 10988]
MSEPQKPKDAQLPQFPDPAQAKPAVPVYECRIILSKQPIEGVYHARVANVEGLSCQSANPRSAMQTLVGRFKQLMAEHHQEGTPITWIDPPEEPKEGERKVFIPVHL